jgi:surface antigen
MRLAAYCCVPCLALSLLACTTAESERQGEAVGTAGGAATGGIPGSQADTGEGKVVTAAAGTLVGGVLGKRFGSRFDERDRQEAALAERNAVAANHAAVWSNPQTGSAGEVRPKRSYTDASGRQCRDYEHTVIVEGQRETGNGTACRQPDGTWRIVN